MAAIVKTPEQLERDKARNAAIRTAKESIRTFFSNPLFAKLPALIQDALKTLAPIARQATSTIALEIAGLFKDKKVLSELDIFKALKVGPNEMKAKVNHCLKLAAPEDRMWISYDPDECTWSFLGVGAKMPENFSPENLIPSIAEHAESPDFLTLSVTQLIDAAKAAKTTPATPVPEDEEDDE